ncbi:hypothetical protein OIU77_019808 [Salix suchowensis]|uniref:Light-harvesting complex-like protein OHP2, chloroplastic n=1 Tax=Salix suchowensis TaxID=1278906 RepID=A0ABQ9CL88_9ROSI|nr:hypothetical protein OIU77_019808 [Salix suchowensis]
MSVASSIPYIKIPNPSPSSPSCSSLSSSSSTSSTSSYYRFSPTTKPYIVTIRSSQAEGPWLPPPKPAARVALEDKNVITLEFQRQKAKELQEYFKKKKLEEADQGPFFGFFGKNEIANGRWAMFGFAVGMLTEYATGSDFVDQVKILLSNFGILDLE